MADGDLIIFVVARRLVLDIEHVFLSILCSEYGRFHADQVIMEEKKEEVHCNLYLTIKCVAQSVDKHI